MQAKIHELWFWFHLLILQLYENIRGDMTVRCTIPQSGAYKSV